MLCRYVRILTGRPQTQGPHELWGQLRAIGLFRETNFYAFHSAFCVMGGWEMKAVAVRAKNTEALARAMEGSTSSRPRRPIGFRCFRARACRQFATTR